MSSSSRRKTMILGGSIPESAVESLKAAQTSFVLRSMIFFIWFKDVLLHVIGMSLH